MSPLRALHSFTNLLRSKSRQRKLKGYESIDGWLTPAEASGLFEIAQTTSRASERDPIVLEIGSWKGKSTFCLAQGLRAGEIHCIDPFNADGEPESKAIYERRQGHNQLLDQFKQNLSSVPPGVRIQIHQGYSHQFTQQFPSLDLLFIDGDHSIKGCRYDFENYAGHLCPGGILAFHDYDPGRKELGPTWVIENLVHRDPSYSPLLCRDSLCAFRKR
jgi:predicted O-methyltransferase YrrM